MSVSKIITLSNFLRKEGMLVSIRSTITASRIWEEYHELADYDELKLAIKCIYVKNKEDSYKFDNILKVLTIGWNDESFLNIVENDFKTLYAKINAYT